MFVVRAVCVLSFSILTFAGCAPSNMTPQASSTNGLALEIDSRVQKLFGGDKGVNAVLFPDQVQAFLVENLPREAKSGELTLAEYPVTAGPVTVKADQSQRLRSILLNPDSYVWESAKACEFMPGVALRYATDQGTLDVLICFSCDEIAVYRDGKRVGGEDIDPVRSQLVEIAKSLFPADEAIQQLSP